jgi:glycosyltransferase involved in cell wall biosynthesis
VLVDDGSVDGTDRLARRGGAEVMTHGAPRRLGAAVRTGLGHAVETGAVAVAFCDADGEYAPEELGRLVGPILDCEADYVVGSRFSGTIPRMRPTGVPATGRWRWR